jgi:hypothetical protein
MTMHDRRTYIGISYFDPAKVADGKEYRWHLRRRDGGPLDGTWDMYETEDEVLEYLRYFLFKREGAIVVERAPHAEFDRRADDLDRTRQCHGRIVDSFAPGSAFHGL